jgi:hypothetical protein
MAAGGPARPRACAAAAAAQPVLFLIRQSVHLVFFLLSFDALPSKVQKGDGWIDVNLHMFPPQPTKD